MIEGCTVKDQVTSIRLRENRCPTCKDLQSVWYMEGDAVRSIFDKTMPERSSLIVDDGHTYHFVQSGFEELTVGRGKENDIEVVDATVSRNHARIYSVESNKIMIEDNSSKYGTFVSFQEPY